MKRGGQVIYAGPLGHQSQHLIEYFEVSSVRLKNYNTFVHFLLYMLMILSFILLQSVPGVPKITEGYNPATWMLEVSSSAVESQLGVDFSEIYSNSDLYR